MGTIYKIEGVYVDRPSNYVWSFDKFLTMKSLDEIKAEVIPYYVENADKTIGEGQLHHIIVSEIPLDRCIEDDEFVKQYTFLPDGSMYVVKEYRNLYGDMEFCGRDKDEVPLKVGDKVEWVGMNCLCFGVIHSLPPRRGVYKYLDAFDDCYTVLEGIDELPEEVTNEEYATRHKHVDVNSVFKRT